MNEKSCSILGAAPLCFPWGYDEEDERCGALKLILLNLINLWRSDGITAFVVALDAGIGLYAAEILGALREKDPEITLTCIVPWEEQAAKWTPELRNRYYDVQTKSTKVEIVSAQRTASCEVEAKLKAIDMAERVFAVAAREEDVMLEVAVHYARRIGKQILLFDSEKIDFHN